MMAKLEPDKNGFISAKVYKYRGVQFQYQGVIDDGRLQFSRMTDGEPLKMSKKLAKEYFG